MAKTLTSLQQLTMQNAHFQTSNSASNNHVPIMESLIHIAHYMKNLTNLELLNSDAGDILSHLQHENLYNSLQHLTIKYCSQMRDDQLLSQLKNFTKLKGISFFNTSNAQQGPISDQGLSQLF